MYSMPLAIVNDPVIRIQAFTPVQGGCRQQLLTGSDNDTGISMAKKTLWNKVKKVIISVFSLLLQCVQNLFSFVMYLH